MRLLTADWLIESRLATLAMVPSLASRQSVSSPSSNMSPPVICVGRRYLRG